MSATRGRVTGAEMVDRKRQKIGVLGGGQLAQMMITASHNLAHSLEVTTLSSEVCAFSNRCLIGNPSSAKHAARLLESVDVVTFESDGLDVDGIFPTDTLEKNPNVSFHPHLQTMRIIRDKYLQKCFFKCRNIPMGPFQTADGFNAKELSFPMMVKSRWMAYDGRGNILVESRNQLESGIAQLSVGVDSTQSNFRYHDPKTKLNAVEVEINRTCVYFESFVDFEMELAVMVVRDCNDALFSYPTTQTIQSDSICRAVIAPAPISADLLRKARELAERIVGCLEGCGVFGVEMFLLKNVLQATNELTANFIGDIYLNEVAARPHNSGHFTIEACVTSQFENHLRAVGHLPIGCTAMKMNHAIMINIIGGESELESVKFCDAAMNIPCATLHWYGKSWRKGRKLGHVTLVGNELGHLLAVANTFSPHFDDKMKAFSVQETIKPSLSPLSSSTNAIQLQSVSTRASGESYIQAAVIMGSSSDLKQMADCCRILESFGILFETTIVSAHRTPDRLVDYAKKAKSRGIKVIVAGAGGAAHLPGMVAAHTTVPVIGVPIPLKLLDGMDSLLSIVQMPRGIPVACVAVGNSTNAGLLAVRILGAADERLCSKLESYMHASTCSVLEKAEILERIGWRACVAEPDSPSTHHDELEKFYS